jgi:flavin-dependent dehydrogenase
VSAKQYLVVNVNTKQTILNVGIIGGGPAGVATALMLQRRGIQCTIIEASATVPAKVGETLPPSALPVLQALGAADLLKDAAHLPCYGNTSLWGSNIVQEKHFIFQTAGNGWHLQRQQFETALIELARQSGVDFIPNTKLMQAVFYEENGCWKLQLKTGEATVNSFNCRFVADAAGRNSKFARSIGIERKHYDTLTGVVAHFKIDDNKPVSQLTHIEAVENGWWYAAALSNGSVVTAFMTDVKLLSKPMQQISGYWQALQKTDLISTLLPTDYVPPAAMVLHTQPAGTSALNSIYGRNWLAVGDAAFAYDPISSYGISSALGGGCYAGNAIADHLNGADEALPAYRYITEKAFAAYLPLLQQQYALETRWAGAAFWKERSIIQDAKMPGL